MGQWFFTKDGQQEGPVTAEQIQGLAKAGQLDPATTHVWCEGMEDWKTLAESGMLAVTPQDPVPQVAAPDESVPYLASDLINEGTGREIQYPGFGRLKYFLTYMGVTVAFYAIMMVMLFAAWKSGGEGAGAAMGIGFFLLAGIMMVVGFYIAYQRVKNLGMSGWSLLWTIVPFMNIWIGWRMLACPAGYDDHKTLDQPGKVITGIAVGLLALMIVGNIIAAFAQ